MKMKLIALCFSVITMAGCRSDIVNVTDSGLASPVAPESVQVCTGRIVDFADSGHHRLIWNVTLQTVDGDKVTCQVASATGFVEYVGLGKLKPYELDRKPDFSTLPMLRIEIKLGPTTGLREPRPIGQLVAWKKIKE
jgi:hypothetical protein